MKRLDAASRGWTDDDVAELCVSLSTYDVLDLSGNRITDVGALMLAETLRKETRRRRLDVSRNAIGDKGICAVVGLIEFGVDVDVTGNQMTYAYALERLESDWEPTLRFASLLGLYGTARHDALAVVVRETNMSFLEVRLRDWLFGFQKEHKLF